MRDHTFRANDFVNRLAWIRPDLSTDNVFVLASADHRLREVKRIRDDGHQCQPVGMTDEMLDDSGAIAPGDTVPPDPTFLEMRCVDRENVTFPLPCGKTHRRV